MADLGTGGDDDNLTISADIFYKILDEEDPAAPSPTPLHLNPYLGRDLDLDLDLDLEGTLEGFDQGRQSCGQVNCEDTFRLQSDMLGSKQYTEDGWKVGTVQQDSSDCMDQLDHSDDWLRLSNSEDNTFIDSVIDDFDCQEFDNNMQPSGSSNESAEMTGFYYPTDADLVNGLYLDSNQERYYVKMGGENSIQGGSEEPESEVINDYSVFMPQNGRDSSQNMLTQTCFGGLVHADMNNTTMSDSILQEGNESVALSTSSPWVPDITLPDIIYTKAENSDTADATFNASDRCPTLRRTMLHVRYGEAQQLHNYGMVNDFKLGTAEEYLRTGIPKVSIMDLDEPLPRILSAEQNYCKDTRFHNESSTDSSPVPSTRYSTSESVDRAVFNTAKRSVPASKTILPGKKQKTLSTDSKEDLIRVSQHKQRGFPSSNETFKWNNSKSISSSDEDADICILDDISGPARPPAPPDKRKFHSLLQRPECSDLYSHGPGVLRADDLQRALQDVSEPTTESNPPDGVLAVPLLRHQRIALSWMVQKETAGRFCTGGILADDQGLGKTISTIALILTERSPPFRSCSMIQKSDHLEALNVDDEDDGGGSASDMKVMNQLQNSGTAMTGRPIKRESPVMVVKGRPAAGTLVVCPTSVIRQWADEIQNKVTRKANLSFLIYYGSNRTKDPIELAKYDVVITTYAIVSMEVPKQPLNDKDDEEKGKADASGPHDGLSTNKKKKNSSNSKSKNQDSSLLDSAARPLARVGWFRVILDEAQSIKNYRTLVARACWGLRAKRRWCLSGTPIQNAVDDLYSYFRFLRYEKLDVYKSFISDIKIPINRNPTTGYKKLQLVLKTIMLRRTKGTLLDGKPIINLPSKTVTLKKVEFSEEERAFYSTLEAESQEQFKEYAAAGTVKQNYVNILLMLLRLRQACDHPLLVKAYGSNSIGKSSMDMVKKLPRDKQINLLNCMEACSAICTICNDPPEDAVVTICGHVFCNQCICEHLTGDDNICPSAHCKLRLTVDSVFSRDTLKGCLSGQSEHDSYPSDPVPHLVKLETGGKSLFSDSSKLKAALEILQSLPVLKSVDTISRSSLDKDKKCLDSCKSSNAQATEKAIVFSQWTKMLDLFEVPLKDSCIQYRRLDGTMSVAARDKAVKDFNSLPEVTVMIMSLKAASLGLNMIAACHVLLLDLWWNPTTEDQAIDRAHRIGQTRPVTVSRLTVNNTVEDRILGLQEKKRKMVASAFGEDDAGSRHSRLTVEELKYLFMA